MTVVFPLPMSIWCTQLSWRCAAHANWFTSSTLYDTGVSTAVHGALVADRVSMHALALSQEESGEELEHQESWVKHPLPVGMGRGVGGDIVTTSCDHRHKRRGFILQLNGAVSQSLLYGHRHWMCGVVKHLLHQCREVLDDAPHSTCSRLHALAMLQPASLQECQCSQVHHSVGCTGIVACLAAHAVKPSKGVGSH